MAQLRTLTAFWQVPSRPGCGPPATSGKGLGGLRGSRLRSEIPAFKLTSGLGPGLPARGVSRGAVPTLTAASGLGSRCGRRRLRRDTAREARDHPAGSGLRWSPAAAVYLATPHPRQPQAARSARRHWAGGLSVAGDFPRGGAARSGNFLVLRPVPLPWPGSREGCCGA